MRKFRAAFPRFHVAGVALFLEDNMEGLFKILIILGGIVLAAFLTVNVVGFFFAVKRINTDIIILIAIIVGIVLFAYIMRDKSKDGQS